MIVVKQKHYHARFIIDYVLEKIYTILPLYLLSEAKNKNPLSTIHFSPYDLTCDSSIGYLVANSMELIKEVNLERQWVNPYREFMDINESIYDLYPSIQ